MSKTARLLMCALSAVMLTAATGYQVNNGANEDITEFSTCKNVANAHASGRAIFVPTNTSAEWTAFYSHAPGGVTISACAPTCAGTTVGGFCWYAGSSISQSCTTICSSHGGYNNGTLSYAGSGGTLANCLAVVAALKSGTTSSANGLTSSAMGCAYTVSPKSAIRFASPATTAAATGAGTDIRVCACNN